MDRLQFHIGERLTVRCIDGNSPSFATIHEEVLLATLLLIFPRELSRGGVSALMWPNQPKHLALQSLRQRLTAINSKLPGLLEVDRRTIRLASPMPVTLAADSDKLRPESVLRQARKLLEGYVDQDEFSDLSREAQRIVDNSANGVMTSSGLAQVSSRLALDLNVAMEDRLDAAITLLASPSLSDDRNQLIALSREIGFLPSTTPEFSERQWFACQAGAMLAHRSGMWSSAYHFQSRASEIARTLGDRQRLHWSEFRRIRIDIDMGLNSRNTVALFKLAKSPHLAPRLRAMCELNLIFASASNGQNEAAQDLIFSCRRSPHIEVEWKAASWLALNEAMSSIVLRSPQNGVSSLLRATRQVEGKIGSLDGVWHWMTAAQVFGALGHSIITAEFSSMVGRALKALNSEVSPQNARLYNAIVAHSARRCTPSEWVKSTEKVDKVPLLELHAYYEERLKEAARMLA